MYVAMYNSMMVYLHLYVGQSDTVQCPHVECGVICELKHYLVSTVIYSDG